MPATLRIPFCYDELASLPRPEGSRAVVVGASMAGLLTARVLSEFFDEVWLLDRDTLPTRNEHRRSTAHSRHAQLLLAGGREAIEQLLPEITGEWIGLGARLADMQGDIAVHQGPHAFARAPCGPSAIAASRPLLESAVRLRVLSLPNVHAATGVDVQGLMVDSRGRVNGVQIDSVHGDHRPLAFVAGLVVDASGRSSRMPAWLRALGQDVPDEDTIAIDLRYATGYFRREDPSSSRDRSRTPPGERDATAATDVHICTPTPAAPFAGLMVALEDDRWAVTLAGFGPDSPPLTLQGFSDRAQCLASDAIGAVARDAEPLCDPIGFRFAASQRQHYERLLHPPPGLLVIGDALCSINPIYSHGMTLAACQALMLRDLLMERSRDKSLQGDGALAERFFARASAIVDGPWHMAASADLALRVVPGKRTMAMRIRHALVSRLSATARRDPFVSRALLDVMHLRKPPSSLLHLDLWWSRWRADDAMPPDGDNYKVRLRTR